MVIKDKKMGTEDDNKEGKEQKRKRKKIRKMKEAGEERTG